MLVWGRVWMLRGRVIERLRVDIERLREDM